MIWWVVEAQSLEVVKRIQSWDKAFTEGVLEELALELGLEEASRRTWLGEGIPGRRSTTG